MLVPKVKYNIFRKLSFSHTHTDKKPIKCKPKKENILQVYETHKKLSSKN